MPIKPALNPRVRDFASGLILAGKFTKDPEAATFPIADLSKNNRLLSCLIIDNAVHDEFEQHYAAPILSVREGGEFILSETALIAARDLAYELNLDDAATCARSLLSELSMRTVPRPAPTQDRAVPKRPALQMSDFVSWPSAFGNQVRGRVEQVHTSGIVKPNDSHPGITATPQNPVATIRVYEQDGNGWTPTNRSVVRPALLVSKVADLARPKGSTLFEVKQKGKSGEILIYSDIGDGMWGGLSAKMFREELNKLKSVDELNVRINSGGGDAFEGVAIYNTLREFKAHKVVHIDGLAASIATVIACAGDVIKMGEGAQYMIHLAWTMGFGNRKDMMKAVERLDLTDKLIAGVYNKRTGLTEKELLKMMDDETWLSPADALEYGFVDEVVEATRVAASVNRDWFKRPPTKADNFDAAENSRRLLLARGRRRAAGR